MDTTKFESYDNESYTMFTTKSAIEKDLNAIWGIMDGIKADHQIHEGELTAVKKWQDSTIKLVNTEPYKSVHNAINMALEDHILTEEEIEGIKHVCDQFIQQTGYFNLTTVALQRLEGIVSGIIADNVLNEQEIKHLDDWMEENSFLQNCWPYDELASFLTFILTDGVITEKEKKELIVFCKSIFGNSPYVEHDNLVESFKQGFCQVDPSVLIQEKTFCITGVSSKYSRKQLAELIELYGGFMVDNISKSLHYLVVCDNKNSCWAYTCYGRKIEKAITYRKSGNPIAIVHELDLYDAIESLK